MNQGVTARKDDVLLLVGTRKGAFILSSDPGRQSWSVSGPHLAGVDVFHLAYDPRDGMVFCASNSPIWGAEVQRTNDLGETWLKATENPKFSGGELTVQRIWHVAPGRSGEPGVVYAGVEPAALFKSEDTGDSWHEVTGLSGHRTRKHWQPGFGGLCLHSIVLDPSSTERMWVGISAVGVFGTEDGGQKWKTMNKGVRADFLPQTFPTFGQCPHKLLAHKARPDILVQQNHCGVFRSDSGGQGWTDVTEGLPSRFGFVIGMHSTDPDTLYVVPEDQGTDDEPGGGTRYVTDARFRVYRTRNGGGDWEPLTHGLPQKNAYLHVMREGMATDELDPCGIYVGASTGQIFYSRDDGDTWELLTDYLPPINSVDCVTVA